MAPKQEFGIQQFSNELSNITRKTVTIKTNFPINHLFIFLLLLEELLSELLSSLYETSSTTKPP